MCRKSPCGDLRQLNIKSYIAWTISGHDQTNILQRSCRSSKTQGWSISLPLTHLKAEEHSSHLVDDWLYLPESSGGFLFSYGRGEFIDNDYSQTWSHVSGTSPSHSQIPCSATSLVSLKASCHITMEAMNSRGFGRDRGVMLSHCTGSAPTCQSC